MQEIRDLGALTGTVQAQLARQNGDLHLLGDGELLEVGQPSVAFGSRFSSCVSNQTHGLSFGLIHPPQIGHYGFTENSPGRPSQASSCVCDCRFQGSGGNARLHGVADDQAGRGLSEHHIATLPGQNAVYPKVLAERGLISIVGKVDPVKAGPECRSSDKVHGSTSDRFRSLYGRQRDPQMSSQARCVAALIGFLERPRDVGPDCFAIWCLLTKRCRHDGGI